VRTTSANDILLFELCPQKWVYEKQKRKGRKQMFAFYRFSSALHDAAKRFTGNDEDIHRAFDAYWGRYEKDYPLVYKPGETWELLSARGHEILSEFVILLAQKGITPVIQEKAFKIYTDEWTYTVQPDMVGERGSKIMPVEYKTTDLPIGPWWVKGSDQLTGQAFAISEEIGETPPIQVAVCNFVKEGPIQWIEDTRSALQIEQYRRKISDAVQRMDGGFFPKRTLYAFSSPCSWCDYREHCYSEGEAIENFAFKK
jgi:PD-(D/E)XK nuclease superfamily